ncbi:MAG TPA: cytochrome P450 [Planctomycetota bacterium]|nr:cytochrome P450 [Planctomycetota bacterium]
MRFRTKLFQFAHPERLASFEGFPGPPPTFPLGNQGAFLRKPAWQVCDQLAEQHGPLALLWIKSRPLVLISDEQLAMAVLSHGKDAFQLETPAELLGFGQPNDSSLLQAGLGHGDPYGSGESVHSLVQTPWLEEWLEERMPLLLADVQERARAFAHETESGPRPLFAALLRVVFQSLTRLTLGQELGHQAFDDFLEFTLGNARKSLGMGVLEEREDLLGTPEERLLAAIGRQISMGQRYPDRERQDLIGHLIEGRYALPESRWAEALLRVYLSTCLQIASQLTNTLSLVGAHPAALEGLLAELDAQPANPSLYQLLHLPVLDGVYREGCRMAPASPLIGRRVRDSRQVDLGGHKLPPGTGALIHLGLLQRDAEIWAEPNTFDPGRWQLAEGPLLERPSEIRLAHGAAQLSNPHERLAEWASKLILFTWLKDHTVLTSEDPMLGKPERYASGLRIPHGIAARVYRRGTQAHPSAHEQDDRIPSSRPMTLLKGSLRFGIPKRGKAQSQ